MTKQIRESEWPNWRDHSNAWQLFEYAARKPEHPDEIGVIESEVVSFYSDGFTCRTSTPSSVPALVILRDEG